jgi:hypothetical protein
MKIFQMTIILMRCVQVALSIIAFCISAFIPVALNLMSFHQIVFTQVALSLMALVELPLIN